jgi:hypothetical protein
MGQIPGRSRQGGLNGYLYAYYPFPILPDHGPQGRDRDREWERSLFLRQRPDVRNMGNPADYYAVKGP